MHAMLHPAIDALPEIAKHVPEFEILLDDLSRVSNDALRQRSLAVFPRVALWLLRDGRDAETLLANLVQWARALDEVARAPNGFEAYAQLMHYISGVVPGWTSNGSMPYSSNSLLPPRRPP